jgi:hypothetical protein
MISKKPEKSPKNVYRKKHEKTVTQRAILAGKNDSI